MALDLVLRNARVVTASEVWEGASLGVVGEKIALIGSSSEVGRGRREFDLEGRVLFPGMFDPHCHLGSGDERTWDFMENSFVEDTRDCLIGGVTSIATTTVLTRDPLPENFRRTIEVGAGASRVDFRVTSVVLTREHVREMKATYDLGCVSFKFYCGYCFQQAEKMGMNPEGVPPDLFFLACEQAKECGDRCLLMIHAEDPHVRGLLGERFRKAERNDLLAWAEHSPDWSEAVQVYQYGAIAHSFSLPLYVVHVSRAYTLELIRQLQRRGQKIIPETLVCFLSTTAGERHAAGCGYQAKIQPPIRYEEDRQALWDAISAGMIQSIGTDTIPYTSKYKGGVSFWEARPGLNIQTIDTLPLLLTEGYHKGKTDLVTLARLLATNPARLFGAGRSKGKIAPGYDADFVVIDLDKKCKLGRSRMRGQSDYSVWEGKEATGTPTMTFLRGQLVAAEGEIVSSKPAGRYLPVS